MHKIYEVLWFSCLVYMCILPLFQKKPLCLCLFGTQILLNPKKELGSVRYEVITETAWTRTKTVCSSKEVRVFIRLLQLDFSPRRPSVFKLAGSFTDSLYSSAGTVWRRERSKCLKRKCDSWQVDVWVWQAGVEGSGCTSGGWHGDPVVKSLWPFAPRSPDFCK